MKKHIIIGVLGLCMLFNYTIMAQGTWTKKADFNERANGHSCAFGIGTKGYVFVGFNDSLKYTRSFNEYDPITNTWTKKADFAGELRADAVGFNIGNKGYIAMGDSDGLYRNDIWEYDPIKDTWTKKSDFPGKERYYALAFSIGNKAYIGLGVDAHYNTYNDLWEYEPFKDKWTKKASFGGDTLQQYNALCFSVNDKGYVYYGDELWEYNPMNDIWTIKTPFPGIRKFSAISFGLFNKGYLGGGNDNISVSELSDFWEYNSLNDTWKQLPNLPDSNRGRDIAFTIGGRGYLTAGADVFTSMALNDLWEYSPDGVGLKEITNNTQNLTIYPNPVNDLITIGFLNTENSLTNLVIKDLLGNTIKEIFANKLLQPNNYEYTCQTNNLANGIYLVCLTNEAGLQVSKKIIIAK